MPRNQSRSAIFHYKTIALIIALALAGYIIALPSSTPTPIDPLTSTPTATITETKTPTRTATTTATPTPTCDGGMLDQSFDSDGKVTTDISSQNDFAYAVAIQPDGKILVGGDSEIGGYYHMALARYNADGSLDTSFNGSGHVTTSLGSVVDEIISVAIQADGKIMAAGFGRIPGQSGAVLVLVRYEPNGTLDTSFGGDGIVTTLIGAYTYARSMVIQPDGKFVVVGYAGTSQYAELLVARFNTDGSLDNTFNGHGYTTLSFGFYEDYARSVAIQPDGKLVVTGATTDVGFSDIFVIRYNTDGSLDTTFGGGDGSVITSFGNYSDSGESVLIQPDGKIAVGGYGSNIFNRDFAIVRYNSDGSLDTSFDGDGKVTTGIGAEDDIGSALMLQADGKLVLAGRYFNEINDDIAIVRYNVDGSLDLSFNGLGIATAPLSSSLNDGGNAAAMQPDGRIVVAGYANYSTSGISSDFAIVRYRTNCVLASPTPTATETFTPTATPTSTPSTTVVTVGTNPGDLEFIVDSVVYHSTQTFNWFPGSIHTLSTESPQGAGSGTQYVWRSWSDGGGPSHPIIVPSEAEAHFTANFTTQYLLTMCCDTDLWVVNPDTGYYNAGQTMQIGGSGVGSSGFSLVEWHGQGNGSYTGSPNAAAVTMNGPISEIAVFEGPAPFPGYGNPAPICTTLGSTADIYPSVITVSGATNNVGSVRVTLNGLRHQAPDNLDFLLVGPQGQAFVLMSDAGGIAPISQTGVNLTFSDTAGQVVPDNEAPVVGYYEPTSWEPGQQSFPSPAPPAPYNEPGSVLGGSVTQTLDGVFGGTNVNGNWKLYVRDDGGTFGTGTTGCVDGGWRIEFTRSMTAFLSGRVTTANGIGIRNAKVVVIGNSLPAPLVAATGSFGYFAFDGLPTGETYVVTVNSQRFTFSTPTRVITLADNVIDADFIADPQE